LHDHENNKLREPLATIDDAVAELDEPIHLCPYHPEWPTQFAAESQRIQEALSFVVAIEHIGSTAVPGLLAKPIIDLMLGAEPQHRLETLRSPLAELGYEDLGEAGVPGRIYLRRRMGTNFNIALIERGGAIWTANLAFRDYLRSNPDAAGEYAAVKRAAIAEGTHSLLAYSHFKSEAVRLLLQRAVEGSRPSM
jgi:GrpB-like predicted nucleotidyltransferase (UPF0157 family)